MTWAPLRTVTSLVDQILSSDHNDTRTSLLHLGGSTGNVKESDYNITGATKLASVATAVVVNNGSGTYADTWPAHVANENYFDIISGGYAIGASPRSMALLNTNQLVVVSNTAPYLTIVDISGVQPIVLAQMSNSALQNPVKIVTQGSYAYLYTNGTTPGTTGRLIRIDLRVPLFPRIDFDLSAFPNQKDIAVQGDYVYLIGPNVVRIWRISTRYLCNSISSLGSSGNGSLCILGGTMLVSDGTNTIRAYDIREPETGLQMVASRSFAGLTSGATAMVANGNKVFCYDKYGAGFHLIIGLVSNSITTPSSPDITLSFYHGGSPISTNGIIISVVACGTHWLLLDSYNYVYYVPSEVNTSEITPGVYADASKLLVGSTPGPQQIIAHREYFYVLYEVANTLMAYRMPFYAHFGAVRTGTISTGPLQTIGNIRATGSGFFNGALDANALTVGGPTTIYGHTYILGTNYDGYLTTDSYTDQICLSIANTSYTTNPIKKVGIEIDLSGVFNINASSVVHGLRVQVGGGSTNYAATFNGGNVGIGTTTPTYLLEVNGAAAKPTSNTWTVTSDARVKEVLGRYTRGLSDIMALAPVRYRLNGAYGHVDDGNEHVSLIAQEVLDHWPSLVGTFKREGVDLYNLDASEITWALVNAVNDLARQQSTAVARIDAMAARIATLEARLR